MKYDSLAGVLVVPRVSNFFFHTVLQTAALIHDTDHPGVSNAVLMKEHPDIGEKFKQKSVAEQKSVDVAWRLLMEDRFKKLRYTIYTNEQELRQVRQLLVNAVIATDIFDKEHSAFRKARWGQGFLRRHLF